MRTVETRFWTKVERGAGCWLWTARIDRGGYGIFSVSRRTLVRAHRYAWELLRGELAPSACLLHRCGDRRCVNPSHLYLGSAHESHEPRAVSEPHAVVERERRQDPLRPRGDRHWTRREPSRVRRGEQSNLSKLCAADVRRIRALHAAGISVDELAQRFVVVRETVLNIVRFRTWRNLATDHHGSAAARW